MVPAKELKKYFKLNGTTYLYDIKNNKYRIRWCYAGDRYSNPWESGSCKRTIEFQEKIINKFIKNNKWRVKK